MDALEVVSRYLGIDGELYQPSPWSSRASLADCYLLPRQSDALHTIRFIRTAQAAGFTLADVRTSLALRAGDMALGKDVQPLIEKRVQDASARIQEMQQVLTVLQAFLAQCHAQAQDDTCHVLAALAPSAL